MDSTTPVNPVSPLATNNKKVGPIITVLVIVLVLIIAALYMFASRVNNAPSDSMTTTQNGVQTTNNSDEVDDIETDLNGSTNGVDDQNF